MDIEKIRIQPPEMADWFCWEAGNWLAKVLMIPLLGHHGISSGFDGLSF
jgi:hypothetical protein